MEERVLRRGNSQSDEAPVSSGMSTARRSLSFPLRALVRDFGESKQVEAGDESRMAVGQGINKK